MWSLCIHLVILLSLDAPDLVILDSPCPLILSLDHLQFHICLIQLLLQLFNPVLQVDLPLLAVLDLLLMGSPLLGLDLVDRFCCVAREGHRSGRKRPQRPRLFQTICSVGTPCARSRWRFRADLRKFGTRCCASPSRLRLDALVHLAPAGIPVPHAQLRTMPERH